MTDPHSPERKAELLAQWRRDAERQTLAQHGSEIAALEQMWLELARGLAAAGVLNAEALAQRLEEQAQRDPENPAWFYGLLRAAQLLRQPASSDPDSLVQ